MIPSQSASLEDPFFVTRDPSSNGASMLAACSRKNPNTPNDRNDPVHPRHPFLTSLLKTINGMKHWIRSSRIAPDWLVIHILGWARYVSQVGRWIGCRGWRWPDMNVEVRKLESEGGPDEPCPPVGGDLQPGNLNGQFWLVHPNDPREKQKGKKLSGAKFKKKNIYI